MVTTFSYSIFRIENVQRSFTKRLAGLRELSYTDRLKILAADTLEKRRLILDTTYCYKLLDGFVTCSIELKKNNNITSARSHDAKLLQPLCHIDTTKYVLIAEYITAIWNNLPADVFQAKTIKTFQNKLTKANLSRYLLIK